MKSKILFLLLTLITIFSLYSFSLNREWQFFDERLIYGEGLFPIPSSISEVFEVIKTYGFNYHFDSQNAFFSNIVVMRSAPAGDFLKVLVSFFFKKNAFYYHVLQLTLHLLNSLLIWFSFFYLFKHLNISERRNTLLPSLFSLLWALHPANVEAVMLVTNWNSLLTYSFCISFVLYTIKKASELKRYSKSEIFTISVFYITSLFLTEYSYTLVFIIFIICFVFSAKSEPLFKNQIAYSASMSVPYICGLILFPLIYFEIILFNTKSSTFLNQFTNFSFERFFFLAPQIFVHFLKLFIFPKDLSLYQTNLVNLAESYLSLKAFISTIIFFAFVLLPYIIFLRSKSNSGILLIYAFLFSLFPFLHIISPTYCLIAERYCYLPLFLFLLSVAFLCGNIFRSQGLLGKVFPALLIFILLAGGVRTFYRTLDWKNTYTLYSSSLNIRSNNIFKGQINSILGYYFNKTGDIPNMQNHIIQGIKELNNGIETLKVRSKNSPESLKVYGLDPISMLITCAYSISESRLNYLKESPEIILAYYEPFIKSYLSYAGNSQIDLYAKLLINNKREKEAVKVLEYGIKQYPFSPFIIYTLSNLYLKQKDIQNAERIISHGYKLYPSYPRMLLRIIKLCILKNDFENLAKYEYLLGLRMHSITGYQKALQLYIKLKNPSQAKACITRLTKIDREDPITLLLKSKYYSLIGEITLIAPTLEEAYKEGKNRFLAGRLNKDLYKTILLNLISFNLTYNNISSAKAYKNELKQLQN